MEDLNHRVAVVIGATSLAAVLPQQPPASCANVESFTGETR
jgi:hypothetical protein